MKRKLFQNGNKEKPCENHQVVNTIQMGLILLLLWLGLIMPNKRCDLQCVVVVMKGILLIVRIFCVFWYIKMREFHIELFSSGCCCWLFYNHVFVLSGKVFTSVLLYD